ncbi:MAG TPA: ABC transporter ATP-binding protein [Ignavibacteriaceae bacterium]|nr:MAG: L-cystine import ATP-binding protein TcyN [Ignavibacteria bacterium ADurb.Bin266]OQY71895.1 MAG: copper ABC transporter ATP-binding protein [Ignavibacteriales bacterium UTCHB2]HQF42962.1 ABC transporter ATP-binding protein [Ignavibacteriaceae bacterium]HQI40687.1 ABC transporter ATP-binding protein [Ignavibacteriaceae bacterium]HQJ45988.1 ABC transporter ATP-binding protein [Ignavibacteriaceae bacterium]
MIELKNIEKSFGKYQVLKDISLNIEPGKITAIVGPNGSGKTTIIKSILGLVKPDKGEILINNKSVIKEHLYRKDIGYMPQVASFPDNLTVTEVFNMISDLRKQSVNGNANLINILQLESEMNKKIKTLSGGNKQKVSACIALMFDPKIIILDEPTAGLDPVASANLKKKIIEQRDAGKTIILTSHIMTEIEELSDNILFLIEGKIVFDGTLKNLVELSGQAKLENAIAAMMDKDFKWN